MDSYYQSKSLPEIDDLRAWLDDSGTKRIIIQNPPPYLNQDAKSEDVHWLNGIPFIDSIMPVLSSMPGLDTSDLKLRTNVNGKLYARLNSNTRANLEKALEILGGMVFMRDLLDVSLTLGMNMTGDGNRTELGELEYRMKYADDIEARKILTQKTIECIENIPILQDSNMICCVPSNSRKMHPIASEASDRLGIPNVSDCIKWMNHGEGETKNCKTTHEKLQLCIDRGIDMSGIPDIHGKNILLLDDLYQSGVNLNFTAVHLKKAGAGKVFGLNLVKALSNS